MISSTVSHLVVAALRIEATLVSTTVLLQLVGHSIAVEDAVAGK